MPPYKPPAHNEKAFNCPHCEAYAAIHWAPVTWTAADNTVRGMANLQLAMCTNCGKYSLWVDEVMVYPDQVTVPSPNADLEDDIQQDYLEAARILDRSPRGAVALLRLAIQKLCRQLGQPGRNINDDIAALVKAGEIPQRVQQALDIVRVVGNNAVHPGQIDLRDDRDTALRLFQLVTLSPSERSHSRRKWRNSTGHYLRRPGSRSSGGTKPHRRRSRTDVAPALAEGDVHASLLPPITPDTARVLGSFSEQLIELGDSAPRVLN
jgi:hypothetical protein